MNVARLVAKRVLDLTITVPLFIASLPLQAIIAVMVAVKLGRPVLFSQERPGLGGAPFTMRKFRTMLTVDPFAGHLDDASRMTPLGALLRSTSLDELPTLWNIVRGDMSLVGPRPLLMRYLDRYTPEQARRHEMRPGLTGLAQISGRNTLSWDEKFRLDLEYVENQCMAMDFRILRKTISAVLRREGIAADGEVTMPEFMGGSPSRTEGRP